MKTGKANLFTVCFMLTTIFSANFVFAGSAAVLPKGVSSLNMDLRGYLPIDTAFDQSGEKESVDADFNTILDANALPGLVPTTVPGLYLGRTEIDFEYESTSLAVSYQYGLTDKLTFGVFIPYHWHKTDLKKAEVVVDNPSDPFLIPVGVCGTPGTPGYDACLTQVVLNFLEAPPFEYEPFETWSDSGLGDIHLGGRYQYFNNDKWNLALTGSIMLPTGEVDDPDNLLDQQFGYGAYALLIEMNHDYKLNDQFQFNGTVGYDFFFPDRTELRVLQNVDQPLVPIANKVKVDRDYGDNLWIELSGGYAISDLFSFNLLYQLGWGGKNKIDGDDPTLNYQSLEDETNFREQIYVVSLSYSTVSRYLDEKASIPFETSLSYRDRFEGFNVNNSQYLEVDFSLYF